ncbi:VOC family protein [Yinghuangia aomiensis]
MTNTDIHGLYARLVVSDAARAIDFYRSALGAEEVEQYTGKDGHIVHAMLRIGGVPIAVKDEGIDPHPNALGGTPVIIALEVADADAVADAMVRGGATVGVPRGRPALRPAQRRLADPFGHVWMIAQPLESLTPDELQQRMQALD